MRKLWLIFVFASFLFCSPFLEYKGVITDEAGVLPQDKQTDLLQIIEDIKNRNDIHVVVATIKSLKGEDISRYAVDLGRHWGIGDEGKNNGILILLELEGKKVKIITGYSVEGILTDALSKIIIEEDMLNEFKKGDFPQGIKNALNSIDKILKTHIKNNLQDLKSTFKDTTFLEFDYGKFNTRYKYGFFEQRFNFFELALYFIQMTAIGFVILIFNAYKKNRFASFAYAFIAFSFVLAPLCMILLIFSTDFTINIYILFFIIISITSYSIYFGYKYPGETYFDGDKKDPVMHIVFTAFGVIFAILSIGSSGGILGLMVGKGGSNGGGSFGGGGARGSW